MPERLALIGAAVGPWVDLSKLRNVYLRVPKLSPDVKLTVELRAPDRKIVISTAGEHAIPDAEWGRVLCASTLRHDTLCTFFTRKVA